MPSRLQPAAFALGIAGIIPFVVCAMAALGLRDDAAGEQWLAALIAYGAVILSFVGAVHWGFVLASPSPEIAEGAGATMPRRWKDTTRLALGVVPAVVGWVALLGPMIGSHSFSIALLIAGFIGTVLIERDFDRQDLLPTGYMWLRWLLTLVVLLVLITVLGLRLVGARIII